MSAVTAFPSLSELLAWPTDHLTEAADNWVAVGGRCYGVANQVWRDVLAVDWQGAAADALRTETDDDMMTTSAVVDQLHEAAKVARSGASDLFAARSRLRYAVQDARAAGFAVGDDLSVTDRLAGGSAAQRAARQAQAQAFAGDIRLRAVQLVGLDQQVAAKVTAAVAGICKAFPQPRVPAILPKDNRVHAVDHHTWKQDPAPPPGPGPTNGPTADDIRRILDKLPVGDRPEVREVRSQQDLDNLWKWMQEHGVERPGGYGGIPGEMRQLPDGTIVGRREAAGSTKLPALDVRIPGEGGYVKVHINPSRGGVPDISAPVRPMQPEAPPVRAPLQPAPVPRPSSSRGQVASGQCHRSLVAARYHQNPSRTRFTRLIVTTDRQYWARMNYPIWTSLPRADDTLAPCPSSVQRRLSDPAKEF
ncbi:hypothetical protein LAUMK35_01306 [Mycobacterium pseudokansasii]|nr:hypothetical protein LAUMK35_01306 [Mycobacterium pseudokansasii]VAZ91396.1 hypothetical protein LAUMK21_01306 [Mycobacterium pseudokansasii]